MNKILLLLIIALNSVSLLGQFSYSEKVGGAHQAILNLNFNEADRIIQEFSLKEQGMVYWLKAYRSFVHFKSTNKNLSADSIINLSKESLKKLESVRREAPFYYYCLADVNLMIGALYLDKNELLRAFQYYTLAKGEINRYRKKFPEFEYGYKHELIEISFNNMLYKQLGLERESSGAKYESLMELANMNQKSDSILRRELKLLCLLLKDFQISDVKNMSADKFIEYNYAVQGPLEALVCAHELRKNRKYGNLKVVLRNSEKLGFTDKNNALNLWYGDFLLNKLNDSAIVFLDTFLKNQQNNKLVNYARFKASLYYYTKDQYRKTDSLIEIINSTSEAYTSEDKQAMYEAERSGNWLPELVKARILFDGGFYNEALNILMNSKSHISDYSNEQKLEYSYRLGRIYHMKDDLEKASIFYKMVINSEQDSEFYYPAYAAYYLGEMLMERGSKEKAYYYFAICKELDSPIYKLSIHKKAEHYLKN